MFSHYWKNGTKVKWNTTFLYIYWTHILLKNSRNLSKHGRHHHHHHPHPHPHPHRHPRKLKSTQQNKSCWIFQAHSLRAKILFCASPLTFLPLSLRRWPFRALPSTVTMVGKYFLRLASHRITLFAFLISEESSGKRSIWYLSNLRKFGKKGQRWVVLLVKVGTLGLENDDHEPGVGPYPWHEYYVVLLFYM